MFRLKISQEELVDTEIENIFNTTFIIEVNGKLILIVAGTTTEQGLKLTVIIDVCIKLKLNISLAFVSMRSFERKEGFDTKNCWKKESLELMKKILETQKNGKIELKK
ncbi:MAG: hypothetical protein P0Y62_10445 [Candidatus Chryseobacterium colombiense]|nr:hypothetical protein [Chryseobacterium sp.]WEK68287.1 MAG: hypothetical protein P0Y62_10445 [Chryseobacterium sp.]